MLSIGTIILWLLGFISILLSLLLYALGLYSIVNAVSDIRHDDISLEEAQSLSPFTICFPAYLPNSLENNPQIDYLADDGFPAATVITLHYFDQNSSNILFTIRERNAPGDPGRLDDFDVPFTISYATGELLYWQTKSSKYLEMIDNVETEFSTMKVK